MSKLKEHRIYKYISEPMRLLGLTLDEVGIAVGGISGFILIDSLSIKLGILVLTFLAVLVLKKYKKLTVGFNLKSFLHWVVGVRFKLPKQWPESWESRWKS